MSDKSGDKSELPFANHGTSLTSKYHGLQMAVRSYRSSKLQHKRTLRRKIVGAPHQSATAPHRYFFAASMNRGSFIYNTSALHWIVMVGDILDVLTYFA
jgi:hypothetical protein